MSDLTVWGLHAGKTEDIDGVFLSKSFVALGWPKVGDLSSLPNDREAFKAKLATVYPEKKPSSIAVSAGQLFRFIFEAKAEDILAYPTKDRQIHIGKFRDSSSIASTRVEIIRIAGRSHGSKASAGHTSLKELCTSLAQL